MHVRSVASVLEGRSNRMTDAVARSIDSSPSPKTSPTPASACAKPLTHPAAGSCTASALARWSRCLATSATTSVTCLIIFLYDAPIAISCRAEDHASIVAAIAARDATKAESLMLHHLDEVRQSLHLESTLVDTDLETIFQDL